MSNKFRFKNSSLLFDCPFCGNPKSPPDSDGQDISYIGRECSHDGQVTLTCSSCGKHFVFPGDCFSDGILVEFKRVDGLPGDHLWSHIKKNYVDTGKVSELLKPDWYDKLLKANQAGPIDEMLVKQKEKLDVNSIVRSTVNLPNGGFILLAENNLGFDINLVDRVQNINDQAFLRRGSLLFMGTNGKEDIDNVVKHLMEVEQYLPTDVRKALPKPQSSPASPSNDNISNFRRKERRKNVAGLAVILTLGLMLSVWVLILWINNSQEMETQMVPKPAQKTTTMQTIPDVSCILTIKDTVNSVNIRDKANVTIGKIVDYLDANDIASVLGGDGGLPGDSWWYITTTHRDKTSQGWVFGNVVDLENSPGCSNIRQIATPFP